MFRNRLLELLPLLMVLPAGRALAAPPTPPTTLAPSTAGPGPTLPQDIRVSVPATGHVDVQTNALTADVADGCKTRLGTEYVQDREGQPHVRAGNVVLVYVGDGSGTLGAAGVSDISIWVHIRDGHDQAASFTRAA